MKKRTKVRGEKRQTRTETRGGGASKRAVGRREGLVGSRKIISQKGKAALIQEKSKKRDSGQPRAIKKAFKEPTKAKANTPAKESKTLPPTRNKRSNEETPKTRPALMPPAPGQFYFHPEEVAAKVSELGWNLLAIDPQDHEEVADIFLTCAVMILQNMETWEASSPGFASSGVTTTILKLYGNTIKSREAKLKRTRVKEHLPDYKQECMKIMLHAIQRHEDLEALRDREEELGLPPSGGRRESNRILFLSRESLTDGSLLRTDRMIPYHNEQGKCVSLPALGAIWGRNENKESWKRWMNAFMEWCHDKAIIRLPTGSKPVPKSKRSELRKRYFEELWATPAKEMKVKLLMQSQGYLYQQSRQNRG
jgi:hypothetical protein